MKLTKANSEPYRRLHDFHVSLNDTLKILTACVRYTFDDLRNGTSELGALITKADAAWKYPPLWKSADKFESDVISRVGAIGIVNVSSAADDFVEGVDAEISRWKDHFALQWPIAKVENEDRFSALALSHCADSSVTDRNTAVMQYFSFLRNCIVHRNGRASKALADFSSSELLMEALAQFERRPAEKIPSFNYNDEIRIGPSQAIFYSHVVRETGQEINKKLIEVLGERGVLKMAVHHTFFARTLPPTHAWKSPEAMIKTMLQGRYLVQDFDTAQVIEKLQGLGLWADCVKQHQALTPSTRKAHAKNVADKPKRRKPSDSIRNRKS